MEEHLEPKRVLQSDAIDRRNISGSTGNLSNQGSLRNHFLKEFFKEP